MPLWTDKKKQIKKKKKRSQNLLSKGVSHCLVNKQLADETLAVAMCQLHGLVHTVFNNFTVRGHSI